MPKNDVWRYVFIVAKICTFMNDIYESFYIISKGKSGMNFNSKHRLTLFKVDGRFFTEFTSTYM